MKHPEDDSQRSLFSWASYIPELRWLFAIPNGGKRNKLEAARLKGLGVKAGVWDMFLPLVRGQYPGMYIEMKAGKNKLTKLQTEFGEAMEAQGYFCVVCYSFIEAKHAIQGYLLIK